MCFFLPSLCVNGRNRQFKGFCWCEQTFAFDAMVPDEFFLPSTCHESRSEGIPSGNSNLDSLINLSHRSRHSLVQKYCRLFFVVFWLQLRWKCFRWGRAVPPEEVGEKTTGGQMHSQNTFLECRHFVFTFFSGSRNTFYALSCRWRKQNVFFFVAWRMQNCTLLKVHSVGSMQSQ